MRSHEHGRADRRGRRGRCVQWHPRVREGESLPGGTSTDAGGSGGTVPTGGAGDGGGTAGGGAFVGGEDCLNGVDDDGDQQADCADPKCVAAGFACMPAASGEGPGFALSRPIASAAATCPGGFSRQIMYEGLTYDPLTCTCGCGEPSPASCSVGGTAYLQAGCSGTSHGVGLWLQRRERRRIVPGLGHARRPWSLPTHRGQQRSSGDVVDHRARHLLGRAEWGGLRCRLGLHAAASAWLLHRGRVRWPRGLRAATRPYEASRGLGLGADRRRPNVHDHRLQLRCGHGPELHGPWRDDHQRLMRKRRPLRRQKPRPVRVRRQRNGALPRVSHQLRRLLRSLRQRHGHRHRAGSRAADAMLLACRFVTADGVGGADGVWGGWGRW